MHAIKIYANVFSQYIYTRTHIYSLQQFEKHWKNLSVLYTERIG